MKKELNVAGSNKKISAKKAIKVKVTNKVKSYAEDPFVLKKNAESRKFLKKHGFPKELLAKSKNGG